MISKYKHGSWNAHCDRCGRKFKAHELRETWDHLMVCSMDWEPQHPQDFVRATPDKQRVPWARPEPAWSFEEEVTFDGDDVTFDGDDVTFDGDGVIW